MRDVIAADSRVLPSDVDGRVVDMAMIIHNRRAEALRSIGRLCALPDRPRFFDDASSDVARCVPAERRPAPQSVRLTSPDGPQRPSTAPPDVE